MRIPLRKLWKQRRRARWKALTSKRGAVVTMGPDGRGGWFWGYSWMFTKRGNQRKPPSRLQEEPEVWG